ncbi:hypothetical protein [Hymenobacter defluvii]|uniref:DUF2029 domain-containing protein n=1 Tax=Hymenobacter defluvii TaxID=2054411 RepID=A0ABS3TH01_9BACT|nr:hypothetical protein [Hymenobacter defluvii]MBO3271874.1 hypothetical protein [Hymenobacter defluvii]
MRTYFYSVFHGTRYAAWFLVAIHAFLLLALVSALYCFGIIRYIPLEHNLSQMDVYWYSQIVRDGYTYSSTGMSNAAFFPLFPYLWRATGFGALGIAVFNVSIFLVAFTLLAQNIRLFPHQTLLLLSTPVLLFMIVPYTEALFFLFASLLLIGLHRRQMLWFILGLLGCGLTRSASTIFTPGLLFMTFLWAAQPGQLWVAIRWGVTGLLTLLLSLGIVAYIQWYQTGEPWGFVLAQQHWHHVLQWPAYPWRTASGINMLWLDGAAMWLGLLSIGICCWLFVRLLQRILAQRQLPAVPSIVVFALGYCVCTFSFILLFQGYSIWNASRYTIATPFFVVLVWHVSRQPAWSFKQYAIGTLFTMVFWQMFGIYTDDFDNFNLGESLWYFGLLTIYIFSYVGWRQLPFRREITMILYVFNLVMQLHLLESFLQSFVVQ